MMESVVLNESIVIEDYVLVESENNDNMDFDEHSYDYCDDDISMSSLEHHSSLSICSDLPSVDPTVFDGDTTKEVNPERRPRLISFGNDEEEALIQSEIFQVSVETLDEQMMKESSSQELTVPCTAESNDETTATGPEKSEPAANKQVRDKTMNMVGMAIECQTKSTGRRWNLKHESLLNPCMLLVDSEPSFKELATFCQTGLFSRDRGALRLLKFTKR
jgi:hypothetical protein